MKILELFSGYGTSSFALKRLGIDYDIVGYSDIDKWANICFKNNHCPNDTEDKLRLGDVKLIDTNKLADFDLLTAGFPCQAFSNAGKMQGELEPRGTLFYEIIRIAEVKQPKYMLLENVKGLTCKKFKGTFNKILSELDRIGYNVYWKVLNSKDYGIPQSRARVWFVCFRKDLNIGFISNNSQNSSNGQIALSKSIAKTSEQPIANGESVGSSPTSDTIFFQFPQPQELRIFIKDILEPMVDEKYYLSPLLQERFLKYLEEKNRKLGVEEPAILDLYNKKIKEDGTSITLTEPHHNNLRLIEGGKALFNPYNKSINEEVSPTIGTCSGTSTAKQSQLVFDKAPGKETEEVYEVNEENDLVRPSYMQFQNGHHSEAHRLYNTEGISQTIKPFGLKIYDRKGFDSRTKGFRESDLSPTLSTKMGTGGNNVPCVIDPKTNLIYTDSIPCIRSGEGSGNKFIVAISNCSKRECGWKEDIAPTLCARDYKDAKIVNKEYGRLRRLTPKECFRLMGFLNDEIKLDGLSDTQKYKLAGNGQDVHMVELIFREMFK